MSEYKNGKWAARIIDLQKDDGSWGYFHSLSMPTSKQPITTEQAIGRLRRLGFTKDDAVIKRALSYMHACLTGEKLVPDNREKRMDGECPSGGVADVDGQNVFTDKQAADSIIVDD